MMSRYSVHYEKFISQFLPFQAFINIIREFRFGRITIAINGSSGSRGCMQYVIQVIYHGIQTNSIQIFVNPSRPSDGN